MKFCIVIPCFNHSETVAAVAAAAKEYAPVLVVDDGSAQPLPDLPGCTVVRLSVNGGKGAALRAGFSRAVTEGFTHAITIDADGQHHAGDISGFITSARAQPDALIVGVRDFIACGTPAGRRRSNAISNFWYHVETGVRLGDTQCGFRCYPLSLVRTLRVRSQRYSYELEFMVRAAWVGAAIVPVPVKCEYQACHLRRSHFRPVVDFVRITTMNIGLVLQSWIVPQSLRAAWSAGQRQTLRRIVADFFTEHAHDPARLAGAVGLGLFCGIAPIWGFQMLTAATLAHLLRLNKATAVLVSNISIPPVMPFILYGGLTLGHRIFSGTGLNFSASEMTMARAVDYLQEWLVGSVILGALVAMAGMAVTYFAAQVFRRR